MKTVLIIDDEENILSLLKNFLEENECKALTAMTLEEGSAILRNSECHMLLLDIKCMKSMGAVLLLGLLSSWGKCQTNCV